MADSLDWIAAFDSSGNCAGASQVVMYNGISYINLVIYGDDPLTPLIDEGISGAEDFYLKVWDASSDDIFTYQSDTNIVSFIGWINTNGAPIPAYNNPNIVYNFLYTPVSFTLSDTLFCSLDDSIFLNTGLPVGGTYSGAGVVNNYFNPNGLTQGVYQITYTYNGNSAITNVHVFEPSITNYNIHRCTSYFWNDSTYTVSGIYIDSSLNMGDCDSISILNLTIEDSAFSLTNITYCDSYTWNGTTYTTSGSYTYLTTNFNGCDSTATLNLTINYSNAGSSSIIACDSFTWNGQIIPTSGIYTQTLTNIGNCDSIHTLTVTINSNSSTTSVTECDSYTWNGTFYTTSGSYTYLTTNIDGCDSTATLNLTINNSTTSTDIKVACDTYTWLDGVTYTSSNNIATMVYINVANCDSIVTLNLTINNSTTSSTDTTVCGESIGFSFNSTLTYCASSPGSNSYANIELVRIIGNGDSIVNNTAGMCDTYEDYTMQYTTLTLGQSYSIKVNLGTCNITEELLILPEYLLIGI